MEKNPTQRYLFKRFCGHRSLYLKVDSTYKGEREVGEDIEQGSTA